eukprot:ANDGO_00636.mRNA.1 Leukotriene A-4 hydrolase homolog
MPAFTDPSSYANIDVYVTKHVHLSLFVDFARSELAGSVRLDMVRTAADVTAAIVTLDTRYLAVSKVSVASTLLDATGQECEFSFADEHRAKGSKLTVRLPDGFDAAAFSLTVEYTTTPQSSAISWLAPVQTTGGKHPFMFTQCQAIHARSLLPCQDTPAVKITYSAAVRCKNPLKVVVSGVLKSTNPVSDDETLFEYEQNTSIPSYLIALACGNLEFRPISHRCGVWSEPEVADLCQSEYSDLEVFVSSAEECLIPYAFGRQDALSMPFSFPYGGMEGTLTFCTPSILAGDKSLMNVLLHEVLHAWSGNLVTSKSWAHFWLNESNDVVLERKVLGRREGQAARHLEVLIGYNALKADVDRYGHDHPFTQLVPPITTEDDPDDAFSSVPYEKGSLFLLAVEQMVDDDPVMDEYYRSYFRTFAHKAIDSDDFKNHFISYFTKQNRQDVLAKIDWDDLLYSPGMPKLMPKIDRSLADVCEASALSKKVDASYFSWTPKQRIYYFEFMLQHACPVDHAVLREMETAYRINDTRNAEIRFAFYQVCLKSGDVSVFPLVEKFLQEFGRMKFVRPLFRSLVQAGPEGNERALTLFARMRNAYHAICSKMVARDLGLAQ